MTLTRSDAAAAIVLAFRGEFDLSNTPDVEDALADAVSSPDSTVVADLSEMTFAGSTMMRALLAAHAAATLRHSRLVLVRPTPIVWHAFEVMGLADHFTVFDTREAALDR